MELPAGMSWYWIIPWAVWTVLKTICDPWAPGFGRFWICALIYAFFDAFGQRIQSWTIWPRYRLRVALYQIRCAPRYYWARYRRRRIEQLVKRGR